MHHVLHTVNQVNFTVQSTSCIVHAVTVNNARYDAHYAQCTLQSLKVNIPCTVEDHGSVDVFCENYKLNESMKLTCLSAFL